MRLCAVACCRRIWDLLDDPTLRQTVELAEAYADGLCTVQVLDEAAGEASLCMEREDITTQQEAAYNAAVCAALRDPFDDRGDPDGNFAARAASDVVDATNNRVVERALQCGLILDIFANPYRSVKIDPPWLTWNSSTVPKIAQAIYDDRAFDRMPILADALEDAGCDNADILNHCRSGSEHVRGCWVLDLLLNKQ